MGIARDKRTGQTWMWPPEEENDANEEFGVAPDDKADAFVSYRTVDGRRKTIKEMIEDIDDAEKKLGYSPTWSGPTTRRVEYGLDRYGRRHGLVRLGLHPGPHGDHAEDQADPAPEGERNALGNGGHSKRAV